MQYGSRVVLAELSSGFLIVASVLLGLLFGSFLNVVIYRLPREQSVAFPPSTCPACGARIRPYDNIPVLSWLALRGKARCCKASISVRYPVVEALGGLMGGAVMRWLVLTLPPDTPWYVAGLTFACYLALSLGLLALLFIDLEHMLLPDPLTLGGAALGLVSVPLRPLGFVEALVGGIGGFLFVYLLFIQGYKMLRGRPGMGLGDAKLLLLAGCWFGWPGALFALVAGALQGTLVAIAVFVAQGKIDEPEAVKQEREQWKRELEQMSDEERQQAEQEMQDDILAEEPDSSLAGARLPFGPFLVLSLLEFLFFSEWIEQWVVETMFVV